MSGKKAVVFGATGLTGSFLLEKLIKDPYWTSIQIFVRQALPLTTTKVVQHVTNFDKLNSYSHLIQGDCLFLCLGTTMRNAGSKKEYLKVEFELPREIIRYAFENGIKSALFISSMGANIKSNYFYLRLKGRVENIIQETGFDECYILRPSLLLGKRKENRFAEKSAKYMVSLFSFLLIGRLKRFRGIEAEYVASAMLKIARYGYQNAIISSEEILKIANA